MFIGHYAPAFVAPAAGGQIKLWHGFVAVQFIDYVWAVFILTGIEEMRVVPGFTEGSAFDLYWNSAAAVPIEVRLPFKLMPI